MDLLDRVSPSFQGFAYLRSTTLPLLGVRVDLAAVTKNSIVVTATLPRTCASNRVGAWLIALSYKDLLVKIDPETIFVYHFIVFGKCSV